jgi:hypothetical protein
MDTEPWRTSVDQDLFVNIMFEATYGVLTLLSQHKWRPCQPIVPLGNVIIHLTVTACQLFLRANMEYKRRKVRVRQYLGRVHDAQKVADGLIMRAMEVWEQELPGIQEPVHLWASYGCLELLLWVLYVVLDSCPNDSSWRQKIIAEMGQATRLLGIQDSSAFEDTLRVFPWMSWSTENTAMLKSCSFSELLNGNWLCLSTMLTWATIRNHRFWPFIVELMMCNRCRSLLFGWLDSRYCHLLA